MYTTGGLFLPDGSGPDVTTRQERIKGEDSFLYEYARYLLHKRLTTERLLSPYANYFYNPMYMPNTTTEDNNANTKINIDRNEIAKKLHKQPENVILREDTNIAVETEPNDDKWTEEKRTIAKTPKSIPKEKQRTGYYDILHDDTEEESVNEEELTEDEKKIDKMKSNDQSMNVGQYNVEKMTLKDIEEVLENVNQGINSTDSNESEDVYENEADELESERYMYDVEKHMHYLEDAIHDLERENQDLKERNAEVEKSCIKAEDTTIENNELKLKLKMLQEDQENDFMSMNNHQKNLDSDKDMITKYEKEIEEYKKQEELYEIDISRLEDLNDQIQSDNKELYDQLKELGEVVEKSDKIIEEYKNEAHFKEEIMRLTKELKEANKELAELKSYCKHMGEHKRKEREKEGRRSQRK